MEMPIYMKAFYNGKRTGIMSLNTLLCILYDAVVEMRECQKVYFKTRDREILVKSKQCEKYVDEILSELRVR